MLRILFSTVFLLSLLSSPGAQALQVNVREHILANGLKILLYRDSLSPQVACRLFYKVGSVNEVPGNTGASHLLEHMLFKGTRKIGVTDWPADSLLVMKIDSAWKAYDALKERGADSLSKAAAFEQYLLLVKKEKPLLKKEELWNLYLENGGTALNAFTTSILTAYFVTLPKNKIELFFWLESDRMDHAVLREYYSERDVVAEERRLRYDNSPMGRYWESLDGIFFEAHPYRNPTIGYATDIANMKKESLEERLKAYYRPNNAILVFAGDFQETEVLRLANRYFGKILPGTTMPPSVSTGEPEQVGEKRFIQHHQAAPRIDLMFHTPGTVHPDLFALDILEGALSGRNGRLYKRLVKELDLCTDAGAANGVQKYTSYFHVYATLREEADPARVEAVLLEELEKLKKEPLSQTEVERVKNNVTASTVEKLQDVEELANELGFWEVMAGWKQVNAFPEGVAAATAETVQAAASRYFKESNRTVGVMVREKEKTP